MAKRFTDTEIWNDPWFRKLSLEAKTFWRFLLDRCDAAGYWKKDYEMSTFQCGFEMTDEVILEINNGKERIKDHGMHLEVVDFISFQYGTLKADVNPHKPIIRLLEYYQSKGYRKGINTLKDKEQDKDKEQERGSVRGGRFTPPSVEEVRAYCLERKNGVNAQKLWDFYTSKDWMVGKNKMKDWKACVRTWEDPKEKPPPKTCKECRTTESSSWIQRNGGYLCGDCDVGLSQRSAGRLGQVTQGAIKTMPS